MGNSPCLKAMSRSGKDTQKIGCSNGREAVAMSKRIKTIACVRATRGAAASRVARALARTGSSALALITFLLSFSAAGACRRRPAQGESPRNAIDESLHQGGDAVFKRINVIAGLA